MPDFTDFIHVFLTAIPVNIALNVITKIIAVCLPFVLMWLGVRKIIIFFSGVLFTGNMTFDEYFKENYPLGNKYISWDELNDFDLPFDFDLPIYE